MKEGDIIILIGPRGKFVVKVAGGMQKISGLGVVDASRLLDAKFGGRIQIADQEYIVLRPSLADTLETLKRKAQIVIPKDSYQIIGSCDIRSGSIVVEGGAGSGALTIALANFVAPNGKVTTYENRNDFAEFAKKNLERAGVDALVEFKVRDITTGIDERSVDAVVVDIPEPEKMVAHARAALRPGGYFAGYVPTMNQVERLVAELKEHEFSEIKTTETLQREIVVGEGAVRPSFDMLGHTGYITVARKLI